MCKDTMLSPRYEKSTIYIVGEARTTVTNPINAHYNNRFFIVFIIDADQEIIIDTGITVMLPITNEFVRSIF
ncbi:MAG TPA: DUF3870 domain-containing protein, partial [Patescibacteria group bacterium]|nr:DUF3870 domain-containing protein [Patescibacteria group bacterium]